MGNSAGQEILVGTAVAVGQRALLIKGKSGSGKSGLALDMISRGATLVADDRVVATSRGEGSILLSAPKPLAGLIEARGLGVLRVPHAPATLAAVLDLDRVEQVRLPDVHNTVIMGEAFPLLYKVESTVFAPMLAAYLSGGRREE